MSTDCGPHSTLIVIELQLKQWKHMRGQNGWFLDEIISHCVEKYVIQKFISYLCSYIWTEQTILHTFTSLFKCSMWMFLVFMKKEMQALKSGHSKCIKFDACSSNNVIGSDFRSHAFMQPNRIHVFIHIYAKSCLLLKNKPCNSLVVPFCICFDHLPQNK